MRILKHLKSYRAEAKNYEQQYSQKLDTFGLLFYYRRWRSGSRVNLLADGVPWLTFSAVDFLEKIVHRKMRVFEWGSGGSSVFFSRRVESVISVEHDPVWSTKVTDHVCETKIRNHQLRLICPEPAGGAVGGDPSNPADYISSTKEFAGTSFKSYAQAIDEFPDAHFDIILVDGRSRPSCFVHAQPKLARGGYLIFDNAERPHYRNVQDRLDAKQWKKNDFPGPGPCAPIFWQTVVWQKPADSN